MKHLKLFENFSKSLSDQDKQEIVQSVRDWSGGYDPTEIHWRKESSNDDPGLEIFLKTVLDPKYNKDLVEQYFLDLQEDREEVPAIIEKKLKPGVQELIDTAIIKLKAINVQNLKIVPDPAGGNVHLDFILNGDKFTISYKERGPYKNGKFQDPVDHVFVMRGGSGNTKLRMLDNWHPDNWQDHHNLDELIKDILNL